MRDSELILKRASKILGVPITEVPKAIQSLLDEINGMDATITRLTRQE